MSWLTRQGARLTGLVGKRDTPDDLWRKCPDCAATVYVAEWRENLHVCPRCGHHDRIGPGARFAITFDDGRHTRVSTSAPPDDPLGFRDTKRYPDRLKAARQATGEREAMAVATGRLGGIEVVVAVQDFAFMGGSMGVAVGAAFVAGCEAAVAARAPFIVFTAAGGARMQEGILSLMQMPRTTAGIAMLRDAGLPYIVVLTDPTTGGVTASYAMLGDIQIAEPNALIGFAGQRVIASTIKETLPEGFQRAEYLLEHGMIDMVTPRAELTATLARIVGLLAPAPA